MLRKVVAANRPVEYLTLATLFTDLVGLDTLKYITASTVTLTESLVSTSWGGTSNVMVLKSTTDIVSKMSLLVSVNLEFNFKIVYLYMEL